MEDGCACRVSILHPLSSILQLGLPSGGGGIRTLGRLAPSPVFKTGNEIPQQPSSPPDTETMSAVLASCLALLAQKSTDLALVVERWDALPQAVRAGIVAMVKASTPK